MRRSSARKLRVNMSIKVYKNGQLIDSTRRYKKSQIFRFIERIPFEEKGLQVLLGVDYGIGSNESWHNDKKSLLIALKAYTEKSELDFLLGG